MVHSFIFKYISYNVIMIIIIINNNSINSHIIYNIFIIYMTIEINRLILISRYMYIL